ncbi:hypothetical protein GW17_00056322, partial [Ensete ventricosum]
MVRALASGLVREKLARRSSGQGEVLRLGSAVGSCKKVGCGSRRDLSDGQVSLVIDFAIPPLRREARAFIVTIAGRSYLRPSPSLSLPMPSHFTTPSVVLAARRA